MNIRCPNCKAESSIPDSYKGKTIRCSGCKQPFTAEPVKVVVLNKKTKSAMQTKSKKEFIDKPGLAFGFLGILFILGGFVSMVDGNEIAGSVAVSCGFLLLASAGVLNRLERIAHHTERLREELKNKKSE